MFYSAKECPYVLLAVGWLICRQDFWIDFHENFGTGRSKPWERKQSVGYWKRFPLYLEICVTLWCPAWVCWDVGTPTITGCVLHRRKPLWVISVWDNCWHVYTLWVLSSLSMFIVLLCLSLYHNVGIVSLVYTGTYGCGVSLRLLLIVLK